jgi:hypothetical protein
MLQYREFPTKTAVIFTLFAGPIALNIYIIMGLISGTLFELTLLEHQGLLGFGALAAVFTLPLAGIIADRVRRLDPLIIFASIIPALFGLIRLTPTGSENLDMFDLLLVVSSFAGLAALMVFWTIRINQSIVVRYRGRTAASFLTLAIILSTLYMIFDQIGLDLDPSGLVIPSVACIVLVSVSTGFKPWRQPHARLAASGSIARYFIPTALILASHMLWYMVTKLQFSQFPFGDPSFGSLSQLVNNPYVELIFLVVGIISAGVIADLRGRKPAFSLVLLMMGLLTIFGSTLYTGFFEDTTALWLLTTLISSERFIEGYLLGICLPLIWPELGSVRTKGTRLSLVWFFFLGYMTLFWAVDLKMVVFGFQFDIPSYLSIWGGQLAIFTSLIALYLIGPIPRILGREIEIEEVAFDFDERQVKKTVDAYVGSDDFDSIKSQLDIIDAGGELSDKDVSEILGDDFKSTLSLRRVPGIGDALAKKLHAAGYDSAVQLAGENAQRLSQKVEGLSVSRAEKILKDARAVVKKSMKRSSKSRG